MRRCCLTLNTNLRPGRLILKLVWYKNDTLCEPNSIFQDPNSLPPCLLSTPGACFRIFKCGRRSETINIHNTGQPSVTYTWYCAKPRPRESLTVCRPRDLSATPRFTSSTSSLKQPPGTAIRALTRHQSGSKPHKRPASRQLHASNSQSTGDCNAAEAGHLVDDRRLPPQNSARESIDGLCKQDTGSEGQLCTAGGWCPLKLQNAHDAHRSAFEVSSPDFRRQAGGPHHVSRPDERWHPHSLLTGLDDADTTA